MMEEIGLLRILLAFAFVIGLILSLGWAMRHFRGHRWVEKVQGVKRLQLVEQLYLDSRHKVVLVKCDEREHLLLIGGNSAAPIAEVKE
jgi:flagellar protein FliO/FliZ